MFLDLLFLHPIVPELDVPQHFLFGFVLSEVVSKTADSIALQKLLVRRYPKRDPRRMDLLLRLAGFLVLGGLLWESTERFVFPIFGAVPDPLFSLPITLTNIDGTIDITMGAMGCLLAWYLAKPDGG
ncbi:hypothetical protein GWN43_04595 [Candidatus Bathyarchaeota archaeon]|nr:hypothetical protein [Candidatus Bathyarchaeota archaeon]